MKSSALAARICVVYCRVSSDKQAREGKGSLDEQERNGLAKAAELGLQVLYVVKDAESAWILDKRTKFQNVLADARAGKFGVMIVDRMNRFTRSEDLGGYMQVMTELRSAGITLIFADKEYESSKTGQLMQFLDAYVSAGEQGARRKQSLQGKRNKVHRLGRPNPGSWAPYGYVWADERKTRLEFDAGESQQITRRIWNHFLSAEHPTLAGTAKALNRDGVTTPREYRNIKRGKNAVKSGPRWTAETVRAMLHDARYWGGDENGMVLTFVWSRHSEPTLIPAYGPAYVTRAEAARVHARLTANREFASRNRGHTPDNLLHGGFVRCAYCGWALASYTYKRPRADGSLLTVYRCIQSNISGVKDCKGVAISAETLDFAVLDALDQQINRGDFLDKLFNAWDRDAEEAMGNVRSIEATLKDIQDNLNNALTRLTTYAPNDPLAAPLEAHARQLADTIPGLEDRRGKALAIVQAARANPTLRLELAKWFDAWMGGVWLMSRATQREFVVALRAKVYLWRAKDRTPRAQVVIALPSSASVLPPAPAAPDPMLHRFKETGSWGLNVDTAEAEQLVAETRRYGYLTIIAKDDHIEKPPSDDPSELMAEIIAELTQQGYTKAVARRMAGHIVTSLPRHPRMAIAATQS